MFLQECIHAAEQLGSIFRLVEAMPFTGCQKCLDWLAGILQCCGHCFLLIQIGSVVIAAMYQHHGNIDLSHTLHR